MNKVQHPKCNSVLGAPPGMTPEECTALPVFRAQYEDGTPVTFSYWQPSAEELALINSGHPVRLGILGRTHAPVLLGVDGDGVC